ncbi:MAG: cytochrome c biogenesis protein CcsA, partial [Acidimicrobiales bacterium]
MEVAGIGTVAVAGAALAACAGVLAPVVGRAWLSRVAVTGLAIGTSVAVAALSWALVTSDFTLAYVAGYTSREASWPYRLAALWAGMEGSLLFWVWVLAGYVVVGRRSLVRHVPALAPAAVAVLCAVALVPLGCVLVLAEPFARLAAPALDGGGLTPVLRHPAMLYHPPLLYLGQVGLAVPFAIAVAGLAGGGLTGAW